MIDANPANLSGPDLLVQAATVEILDASARADKAKIVDFNSAAKAVLDQRKMRRLARRTVSIIDQPAE